MAPFATVPEPEAMPVVGWSEAGVVGLAYELGCGPVEQLDLAPSAVTRGPDDVRAAVPGLPTELEPTFLMAAGMLDVGGGLWGAAGGHRLLAAR